MLLLYGITLFSLFFCLFFYIFITWNYNYWKKRKIPFAQPMFPYGNIREALLMKKSFADCINDLYYKYDKCRYFGIFMCRQPMLFVRDPDLIKSILFKNFVNFRDNTAHVNEHADSLFGKNPFVLNGYRWKLVRSQITPALTSGKIKQMFLNMEIVTKRLVSHIENNISEFEKGVNVKDLALKFTTETFALCGFNVNAQSFDNPNSDFLEVAKKIFQGDGYTALVGFSFLVIDPLFVHLLRVKITDNDASNFFRNFAKHILKYRENNNISINDYFDQLIQLRNKKGEYDFDDEHVSAHVATLFLEGVETTASALTSTLYELAANEDAFKKLRNEIDLTLKKYNDELTYEAVQEMKYLDCCFSEALRKNVTVIGIVRQCTEPYQFPSIKENDTNNNGFMLEKGTSVFIPVHAIHHDPRYYPDPEKFDPERFSDQNKLSRDEYTYMPFGGGPRLCLGSRYATIQVKAAVAAIVKNFDLKVNDAMQGPLKPSGLSIIFVPNQTVQLNFYKRSD